ECVAELVAGEDRGVSLHVAGLGKQLEQRWCIGRGAGGHVGGDTGERAVHGVPAIIGQILGPCAAHRRAADGAAGRGADVRKLHVSSPWWRARLHAVIAASSLSTSPPRTARSPVTEAGIRASSRAASR